MYYNCSVSLSLPYHILWGLLKIKGLLMYWKSRTYLIQQLWLNVYFQRDVRDCEVWLLWVLFVCVCMVGYLLKKHKSHNVMGVWGRNWKTPYGALPVSCRRAKCRMTEHSLLPLYSHTHTHPATHPHTRTHTLQLTNMLPLSHTLRYTHSGSPQLCEKTSGLMTLNTRSTLEML